MRGAWLLAAAILFGCGASEGFDDRRSYKDGAKTVPSRDADQVLKDVEKSPQADSGDDRLEAGDSQAKNIDDFSPAAAKDENEDGTDEVALAAETADEDTMDSAMNEINSPAGEDRQFSRVAITENNICEIIANDLICRGNTSLEVPTVTEPRGIVAGLKHFCVLDGKQLVCFGDNTMNQLEGIPTLTAPTAISAGFNHTCVVDGELKCFGGNNLNNEIAPPALEGISALSAGRQHSCAVANQEVVCWGVDDPSHGQIYPPEDIQNPINIQAAYSASCINDGGELRCFGGGAYGIRQAPTDITVEHLYGGFYNMCALSADEMICWGSPSYGVSSPPELDVSEIEDVVMGPFTICASVNSREEAICWGKLQSL